MFELFDPQGDVRITAGNLPHWFQPGATYFVTFRTEDSLPKEVADSWRRGRDDWLRIRGINASLPSWQAEFRALSVDSQRQYHKLFSEEYLSLLDKGSGACLLRRRELAQIVAESLRHFDGDRYLLGDFVVMPNHVHLLVGLVGETDIEKQCYSWKKYSAREINRVLGREGRFWQEESFDHLVRTPEAFERFRLYIEANGKTAGLAHTEYLFCQSRHGVCVTHT
jgi:type I restriction enzyme R subunit